MLTIKKSSFPFRAWMAVRKAMPHPWNDPDVIEKKLSHMNLCHFFWDVILGSLLIGFTHLQVLVVGLVTGPLAWGFCFVMTFFMFLVGYWPSESISRVRKLLNNEDKVFPINRHLEHLLMWLIAVPFCLTGLNESPSVVRHYPTLTIFGRSIYPYHLLVPALLWWIFSAGAQAYHTSSDFAHQVDMLGYVLALITSGVTIGMIIVYFSKSDSGKLLRAYLKAKKDRVCPRIEFIDDEQNV